MGLTRRARDMTDQTQTRRALHGVAELVMAGPEYRTSKTIRLRVTSSGFGTLADPALRVEDGNLICARGSVPINGHSCAELGEQAQVDIGPPADLYQDGSGVSPREKLAIDAAVASLIVVGFETGAEALRRFAPDTRAVLWPEHFDVSTTVDEVTYGVSAGDSYLGEPYAYVSTGAGRQDPFFNAPFGAARPLRELGSPDDVVGYFTEGQDLLRGS
jgi:hypothetical protein